MSTDTYREAVHDDIVAMFDIRTSVRENTMTTKQLRDMGISAELVQTMITQDGKGWVAEVNGRVVGFCIADQRDGSIFALYVLPGFEGRGHGRSLLEAGISYLSDIGKDRVWLTVGPNTRAHRFYLKHGWIETGAVENGDVRMEKQVR